MPPATKRRRVDDQPPAEESQSDNLEEVEVEMIDPHGDAILAVAVSRHRFKRVSTIVLSEASPVFKAMFSNRFAEGQRLSSASPPVIALPDDGSELVDLLKMLHHQYGFCDVIGAIVASSGSRLRELIAVADKYLVLQRVKPLLVGRLRSRCDEYDDWEDIYLAMACAYELQDKATFYRLSMRFVMRGYFDQRSFLEMTNEYEGQGLPKKIDLLLLDMQSSVNERLTSYCLERILPLMGHGAYGNELRKGSWLHASYVEILHRREGSSLRNQENAILSLLERVKSSLASRSLFANYPDYRSAVITALSEVMAEWKELQACWGICLDCYEETGFPVRFTREDRSCTHMQLENLRGYKIVDDTKIVKMLLPRAWQSASVT